MIKTQIGLGATLAALAISASAQSAAPKSYIVQLIDAPTATYNGGVTGYAPTRAAPGTRLDVTSASVQAYTAYLAQKQSSTINSINPSKVTYRYNTLVNGFAAQLTDAELTKLVADPAVRSVTLDEPMPMDTISTPSFLGINSAPNGVWTRTDANGRVIKGEGVIIGHLDGGVWPENASFSDKVDAQGKPVASHLPGTVVYNALPAGRWKGVCQPGSGFNASHCNNKLIGARFFNSTWKSAVAAGNVITWSGEYLDSPRDADGHGSHTLSTSGGNEGVQALLDGLPFIISGIAPRARVASYKVCYVTANALDVPGQGSCFQSDSVAAAEAAVNDGVDVINFSVGGSRTSFNDAVSTAFANASFAGVFVATSAGNSNVFPGNASTVAHLGPWQMTVGNSTHDRYTEAVVALGAGASVQGASFQTQGVGTVRLIWSRDAGAGGAGSPAGAGTNQALCFGAADGVAPLLNPALVAGKILVCDRGNNALVNKVINAKAAGALGVIILNRPAEGAVAASSNTTPLILAVLPTVHVANNGFAAVTTEARLANGTASMGGAFQVAGVVAPVMADSSSRGPNTADTNLLKPEITGPGTDIIAAYTNTSITPAQRLQIIAGTLIPGAGANMISGTSMSSPHVAGAAALLKQANPTWSPYAIKSALMTSSQQTVKLASGAADANRWGFGAGHLNPNSALDTQVVYDQTVGDHVNYFNRAINGRQLNIASMTHANVVGVGSLTRTLTNKGRTAVTYNASANLPGFTVSVAPASLTIAAGASASYTVTMTRTTAPIEAWVFGDVTWAGAGLPSVRSPLSAKPSSFIGPSTVSDARAIGTKVFTVGFGYTGPLVITPIGLVPATTFSGRIATNQRQCYPVAVPSDTKVLRAQIFNLDTEGGSASDLDLAVVRGTTTVGFSGGGDSDELVSLTNPIAANYSVCVDGFAPVNGSAAYRVSVWMVGATGPGTLRAFGPSSVTTGGTASIGLSWNVPSGRRYLGLVEFRSAVGGATVASTQAFIEANPGVAGTNFAPVLKDKPVAVNAH
jgi:subtilisin family serine protease